MSAPKIKVTNPSGENAINKIPTTITSTDLK